MSIVSLRDNPFWVNSQYQIEGLKKFIEYIRNQNPDNSKWLEIGSYTGESAKIFLSYDFIKKLYCIDTWSKHPELTLNSMPFLEAEDLNKVKQIFFTKLDSEIQSGRCVPIEDSSKNAFEYIDEMFDVIYLDGSHSRKDVLQDLTLWYSKLKFGGFMCGHDFTFDQNSALYTCSQGIQDFISSISRFKTIEFHIFKDGSWAFQKLEKYF
ncbi:MAG: hypothetical protein RL736_949 [Pseudomonadota bacterium]|jgi:predicted O-methyltransferase YrrM